MCRHGCRSSRQPTHRYSSTRPRRHLSRQKPWMAASRLLPLGPPDSSGYFCSLGIHHPMKPTLHIRIVHCFSLFLLLLVSACGAGTPAPAPLASPTPLYLVTVPSDATPTATPFQPV